LVGGDKETNTELSEARILFANRREAGRQLAALLSEYVGRRAVVLAIPNGGVPLGIEIAEALKADLEVLVCRKLALPTNPEGGLGAVAEDGTQILNQDVIERDHISAEQIDYEAEKVKTNVRERSLKYREILPPGRLVGRPAIIVDDGLASGITMQVAVESVRHRRPKEVIAAVPVASATGFKRASAAADRVVCCATASQPKFYLADFFQHWRDIADDETGRYLQRWREQHGFQ
jgi:putative phosphoribosyl transferase